jgi:hypothetical protein
MKGSMVSKDVLANFPVSLQWVYVTYREMSVTFNLYDTIPLRIMLNRGAQLPRLNII